MFTLGGFARAGGVSARIYAYDAIAAWFAANPEWEPCGPSIERYLRDEGMAANPEELETGLLFPIRRKEC